MLTFTTLFPHAGRPTHGVFVENRLQHLVASGQATSTVVAPVPWFPSGSTRFGDWARHSRAQRAEIRNGLTVFHPRYAHVPKAGMSVAPLSLLVAAILQVRKLHATGLKFDLIDAHYVYPDGVAAAALGRLLKLPVVITARGSDVTQYPDFRMPRQMIRWATTKAAALISVSNGLKNAMVELGVQQQKITVLRNGVDLDLFCPTDSKPIEYLEHVTGPLLLSVGHLIERKRHDIAIRALLDLPDWTLAIVGEGPEEPTLRRLAASLGVQDRVIFCGSHPHHVLPRFYSAADILILASSREGWANVLLEAMACGTPVVASNIPGNPEVVSDPSAGEIVHENTTSCFATTIKRVYARGLTRNQVRNYASHFGWEATTNGQLALFRRILGHDRATSDRTELVRSG